MAGLRLQIVQQPMGLACCSCVPAWSLPPSQAHCANFFGQDFLVLLEFFHLRWVLALGAPRVLLSLQVEKADQRINALDV